MKKYLLSTVLVLVALFAVGQDSVKIKGKGESIRPIKIWKNGRTMDATDIDLVVVYDNLNSYATLYYVLKDSASVVLSDGNITLDDEEYKKWVLAPNRIRWVYNFAVRFLRLQ
jgi:hypothetical protein